MIHLQIAANGLVLGGLYACIAVGFSLVWGVLNIINILHGSLIILGAYAAFFAHAQLGIHPFAFVPVAGAALFALGYALQAGIINRVMGAPVLITLTLTFGLNLVLDNAMTSWPNRPWPRPGMHRARKYRGGRRASSRSCRHGGKTRHLFAG